MTWSEHAACKGRTALFFPVGEDPESYKPALAICAVCPVRDECLADALAKGEMDGVRGEMTPADRRQLHRGATRACVECGDRFLLAGAPRRVCSDACAMVRGRRQRVERSQRYRGGTSVAR